MTVSDHHALSDRVLNLYLYPIGGWALGLLGLYLTGHQAWALPLLLPVAAWQIGLTAWWGTGLLRRLHAGAVTRAQANAGVRSVGRLLTGSSLCPAIVFLTDDPLAPSAWSTTVGVLAVAALCWGAVAALERLSWRLAHAAVLTLAALALPVNTTGAVTVATMVGLFDRVVDATPLPDGIDPDSF